MTPAELTAFNERLDRELDDVGRAYAAAGVPEAIASVGGLPLVTLDGLRQRIADAPPVEWLADGLLPADGLSLLVGPPKSGKSTLARCLVHAVASGDGKWLGRSVRQGPALHLALEERPRTIAGHYDRLQTPGGSVHVLVGAAPNPAERFEMLRASVDVLRPSVVVIDTIFRFLRITDGNAYSEASAAFEPVLTLAREAGTHVVAVHHSRKGGGARGDEVLGSQALNASVDTVISLKVSPEGRRSAYCFGRDGVDVEETVLALNEETGWVGVAGTTREASHAALEAEVIEFLDGRDEPATRPEVEAGVDRRAADVRAALKRLGDDGKITRTGAGRRGDPFLFEFPVPCPTP